MSIYDALLAEDADRGEPTRFRAYAAPSMTARAMTFDSACAAARGTLCELSKGSPTFCNPALHDCNWIKAYVQNDATLFTCPHEVRCGLIPVGEAGSCTAAQCNVTPPCGGQTPCADGSCPPCDYPQPPGDNTLLYEGLGVAAIAAVMLLAKPTQVNKVLYAKPA